MELLLLSGLEPLTLESGAGVTVTSVSDMGSGCFRLRLIPISVKGQTEMANRRKIALQDIDNKLPLLYDQASIEIPAGWP